jgi:RHS repeat-associated protein
MQRETLHVMDDAQRLALVETRTQGDDGSPARLTRYQLGNHLESCCLELDDAGQVISYEEYYPYGSTSYQALTSGTRTAGKRYRYTAKERDEETGLAYHGARYYAPWLGRWCTPDPAGVSEGVNLFRYVDNQPTHLVDPTGRAGQPGAQQKTGTIPVASGFVKSSDEFGGLPDFAADPRVKQMTQAEFDEASVPNVQVFHVIRDLGPQGSAGRFGPGAHSFALVVIKDPALFNPLDDPQFAGRLNFQDTIDEDSTQYAFEEAPELLETGEGRFFFTVGAYNANRTADLDSPRYLDVKINEQTDRVDAAEFINTRVNAHSANASGAMGYRVTANIPAEQLVNEMLDLAATYRSTGVTIPYPSKCENVLGTGWALIGSSSVTNSNSFARSLLMHAGAANATSDMSGADTGMDVLIPASTFRTGVVNQPAPPWCPF